MDSSPSMVFSQGVPKPADDSQVKVARESSLGAESIVSGVQITNKVDEEDFYENYREVKLAFSNGYQTLTTLSSAGKANDVTTLEQPVETSFVNILGVSTFGHMPADSWLGVRHTGFRSGLSEIRVFGCTEGRTT